MDEITDDDAWNQLVELDKQTGDAWKNEDPSLGQVLKWIEDNPEDSRSDHKAHWRIDISDLDPWEMREGLESRRLEPLVVFFILYSIIENDYTYIYISILYKLYII